MSITPSAKHNGWHYDQQNGRVSARFGGTEVFDFDANDMAIAQALTTNGALTAGAAITSTVTGNGYIAATGNIALGGAPAFATTQGQGLIKFGGTSLTGIAPVGAIATSGAVFASDTVVMKIVAGGTANNIET